MRKMLLFLFLLLILTGCTKLDSNNSEYVDCVNDIISFKNKYINSVSIGYKYFLPKGVTIVKDNDFNIKYAVDNCEMYLYVDIVSYYYKRKLNLEDNNQYDYFSKITNKNKNGYIAVKEDHGNYYVKIVYNYSKMEFYASQEQLPKIISLSTIILNSIDYNKVTIERILRNTSISSREITYQIEDLKKSKSSFSQYLNEYVKEEEKEELPEE